MIERIYLNKDWLFIDNNRRSNVCIPHSVCVLPYNYINEKDYQKITTYEKIINIDSISTNKNYILTFEGVAHKSDIYIDDALVISHYCGYDSFSVDITKYIKKQIKIKVVVDSNENLNIPPFGNVIDYLTYGGIYRDVYLDICDEFYCTDVFVKPYNDNDKWYIISSVTLNRIHDYNIKIYFKDKLINSVDVKPISLVSDTKIEFENPILWDIDNPNLYKIVIEVCNDKLEDYFGLRTVKFLNDGFYLNNKKIKILGLNRHQAYPYVGYAMPKSMQELDAKILKNELNVNAVRTSHYMQSKYFISMCDKLGLLVFTETPGWQYLGDEKWKDQVLENTKNMVLQYRNHPSIILWGARINESVDDHDLYIKTNKIIHDLDPTRQTGGVRCYQKGEELEDVYTYNDFYDPNEVRGLSEKKNVCSSDIPYLVSEFNGHMHPTKMYDREDVRVNQALRICKGMNEFYGDDEITGFFTWCFADYNTHKDFGSGDRICYHGVLDMFRNPKLASYIYSSQGKNNYFNLSSDLNIGDYDASMIDKIYAFTNADKINLYRNGELIKVYDDKNRVYNNIPNSPILIDDFVGNLLVKNEGYDEKTSNMMKEVLYATLKYGNKMPLKYKLMYLRLMLFKHVNYQKGYELYGKYIGNWGSKEIVYKFEAIKDNKVFKEINLSKVRECHLGINVSNKKLYDNYTYDVSLVRISALSQNNIVLPYYNEPFKVSAEGGIDIIGPSLLSFKGGYSGIFVKSNGNSNKGKLLIETSIGKEEIEFEIEK